MNTPTFPLAVQLIRFTDSDGKEVTMVYTDREYCVVTKPNVTDYIREIEDMYNEWHLRGHTWSMSACLNSLTFQRRVIEVKSFAELEQMVSKNPTAMRSANVSGMFWGLIVLPEYLKKWDEGIEPRLISPALRNTGHQLQL